MLPGKIEQFEMMFVRFFVAAALELLGPSGTVAAGAVADFAEASQYTAVVVGVDFGSFAAGYEMGSQYTVAELACYRSRWIVGRGDSRRIAVRIVAGLLEMCSHHQDRHWS